MTMTATRKKSRKSEVILLNAKDQETLAAALLDENPSVEKHAKLRRAIGRGRKMSGTA